MNPKVAKPAYRELLDTEKNSLLNFQFNDFHDYHEYHEHHSDYNKSKPRQLSHLDKVQLKQNYLQGNFKFLVNPQFEENIKYVDPDQEVKWKTIEKVKYVTNGLVGCPICLNEYYSMTFPKITRCGHIFCWPCVLKYLSFKNNKCPLCDDFLRVEDLKIVDIVHYTPLKPGEVIAMKLKRRRRAENTVYSGDIFTEEEDFMRIKKLEWDEILRMNEEETKSLVDYISIAEMEGDKEAVTCMKEAFSVLSSNSEKIHKFLVQDKQKRARYSDGEGKEPEISSDEELLYYYQESNGLNIFLHPINNKYLKQQFNDDLPLTLEAPLIDSKSFQQTEVTQKRYKFLNHIPQRSDVSFAEIDMKAILNETTLKNLEEEMDLYKLNNSKKEKLLLKASVSQPAPPVASYRPPLVETDYKLNIELPTSPSELKLDDIHDYPELSAANPSDTLSSAQNAWATKIPPLKKSQNKKGLARHHSTNNAVLTSSKNLKEQEKEEYKLEDFEKPRFQEENNDLLGTWLVVQPDKNSRKQKKF